MLVLKVASLFQPAPSPVAANAIYSSNKLPFFDANILATTYVQNRIFLHFFLLPDIPFNMYSVLQNIIGCKVARQLEKVSRRIQ